MGETIEAWLGFPEPDRHDAAHNDFWQVRPDGCLFLLRGYDEDVEAQPGTAIDITLPIWRVGETLLYAARLARESGEEDQEILVRCRYTGLRNRHLTSLSGRRIISRPYVSFDDEIVLETQVSVSQLEDNTAEIVHPLLKPLYERFSFFELSVILVAQELERLRQGRF